MGKFEHQLPLQQEQVRVRRSGSALFCERCSMALSTICGFKCAVVLILSVAAFVSAILWVFPYHKRPLGFEAKDSVKQSATVQAFIKLPKPVALLVPQIPRLEYDIYGEIGFPYTKVSILSMNESNESNSSTDVVFGVLSDPANVPLNPVASSVLKSSLVDLFLKELNLTLTNSTFGQPSSFEILKFPGGITVIPEQSPAIWLMPQILFNFTLNNSIDDIVSKFVELKEQLKLGLRLRPYENVYVQVTNKIGSTKDPPITVQASVISDLGPMQPQRLKQLFHTITGPQAKNLGLDNSVFGKVNQISLSSLLSNINSNPPTPSPAPSPVQDDYTVPIPPSNSPAPSPYPNGGPPGSLAPISSSPPPSIVDSPPPLPSRHCGGEISPDSSPKSYPPALPPSRGPTPQAYPGLSPLPVVSYGSHSNQKGSASPPPGSVLPISSSSSQSVLSYKQIRWLCFFSLATYVLLSWSYK